jgi:hypothetical protein
MLTFNFGEEPVIQTNRIDNLLAREFAAEKNLTKPEVQMLKQFEEDQLKVQELMRKKMGGS